MTGKRRERQAPAAGLGEDKGNPLLLRGPKTWTVGLLCVFLVAGYLTRFWGLGEKSLWVDEIITEQAAKAGALESSRYAWETVTPPLHFYAAILELKLGDSEWHLRLFPALLGAFSIPLLLVLGCRHGGLLVGGMAAMLLLASRLHLHLSQDARMYSYAVFLTIISTILLIEFVRESENGGMRRSLVWMAGYTCSAILNVYINYFSFFVYGGQFLFLTILALREWRKGRSGTAWLLILFVLGTGAVMTTSYLPWLPALAGLAKKQVTGQMRDPGQALDIIRVLAGNFASFKLIPGCGLALLAALGAWSMRRDRMLLHSLCLIVPPLAWITLMGTAHRVDARYFAFLLPEYYILVGRGLKTAGNWIAALPRSLREKNRRTVSAGVVSCALLGAYLATCLPTLADYYRGEKQNWRAAADYIIRNARNGDTILGGMHWSGGALQAYIKRLGTAKRFRHIDRCRNPDCFYKALHGKSRGWLVTSHEKELRSSYAEFGQVIERHMHEVERFRAFEEWGEIVVFELNSPESSQPAP